MRMVLFRLITNPIELHVCFWDNLCFYYRVTITVDTELSFTTSVSGWGWGGYLIDFVLTRCVES